MHSMTPHEKLIIVRIVKDAIKYGVSAVLSSYTAIKDYGYKWTSDHFKYVKVIELMVRAEE